MKSAEEPTHAFIIRIWIERREITDAEPIWRGVIEHVGSGERTYFNKLEQIAMHVTPYIELMGVKVDKSKT